MFSACVHSSPRQQHSSINSSIREMNQSLDIFLNFRSSVQNIVQIIILISLKLRLYMSFRGLSRHTANVVIKNIKKYTCYAYCVQKAYPHLQRTTLCPPRVSVYRGRSHKNISGKFIEGNEGKYKSLFKSPENKDLTKKVSTYLHRGELDSHGDEKAFNRAFKPLEEKTDGILQEVDDYSRDEIESLNENINESE